MHGPFLLRLVACSAVCTASFVISETGLGAFFEPNSKAQSPSPHSSASDGTLLEPVKSDYYYYFDRRASILSPLEIQVSKVKTKSRSLGLGGVRGGYELAGSRPSFRIKSGQHQEFLIRLSPMFGRIRQYEDVMKTYVFLSPASSQRGRRDVVTVQWPLIGRPRINEDRIPCDVKAYGDSSVLVAPREALPAREHAFMFSDPHYSSENEAYSTRSAEMRVNPLQADHDLRSREVWIAAGRSRRLSWR